MAEKAKVFDPFGSDPAIVAMGRSDIKQQSFNPEVSPFTPMADLGSWRVIAAEYTGKAVAVMQTSDSRLLVCTSPSFNSKCRHPGTACLDWDNVKLSPAQGSQPDSGVDNTEDQEQEKRAMVEKWSEDAARHTGEWTEDINGSSEWQESSTFHPAAEWTEATAQSPLWVTPQGETHLVPWSPVDIEPANMAAPGTGPGYNNLHITVEYHNPPPDMFSPMGPPSSGFTESQAHGDPSLSPTTSTVIGRSGFGNDPLMVFQDPSFLHSLPPGEDSWSMGLGLDFMKMGLEDSTGYGEREMKSLDAAVDRQEMERKREEFKNKILSNCGLIQEQSDEDKIRQDFKKQILSNIDKQELVIPPEIAAKSNDEKIRDDFKQRILSNLS